jgi:hypothetical protein
MSARRVSGIISAPFGATLHLNATRGASHALNGASDAPAFTPRHMSRTHLRKIGSLLGLLAILMSVLAPTISQTMAAQHRLGDALTTFCTMDPASMKPASGAPSHDTPDHSLAQHWQACAYCSLLAHVPVLPGTVAQLAVALTLARISAAPSVHEVRAPVFYTAAQPRAPPVFS